MHRGAGAGGGSTRFRSADALPGHRVRRHVRARARARPEGRLRRRGPHPHHRRRRGGVRRSRQPRLRQPRRVAGRLLAGLAPRARRGTRRRRQCPAPGFVGVLLPLGGPGEPRAARLGLGADDRLQPAVGRDLLLRGRRRPAVAARGSSRELRDPGSEAVGLVRRAPHGGSDARPRRPRLQRRLHAAAPGRHEPGRRARRRAVRPVPPVGPVHSRPLHGQRPRPRRPGPPRHARDHGQGRALLRGRGLRLGHAHHPHRGQPLPRPALAPDLSGWTS